MPHLIFQSAASWCLSELGKSLFLFVFLAFSLSFIIVPLFYLSSLLFAPQLPREMDCFCFSCCYSWPSKNGANNLKLSVVSKSHPVCIVMKKKFLCDTDWHGCNQRTFIDWFRSQPCQGGCGDSEILVDEKIGTSQKSILATQKANCLGLHQRRSGQHGEGGDCSPFALGDLL